MSPEFWFCLGSAGIGLAIALIAVALSQLHDDLKKILQRWAALDNLGLFNPDNENERVASLLSEINDLRKEIDPALLRVLDRNQQWREGHEVGLDAKGNHRKGSRDAG